MTTLTRSEAGSQAFPPSERRGPAWLLPAIARVDVMLASTPAPLDAQVKRSVELLLRRHGVPTLADLVLGSAATPFVPLLDALANDLGVNDLRLVSLGEATLLAYLHVRLQDDVVDEPETWGRDAVFGVEALSSASTAAFAEACGAESPAFFRLRANVMSRFAATAAEELSCRVARRPLATERIADKFLPLAPCLAAVAFAARRPSLGDSLVSLVLTLGDALQAANDLLNVAEDSSAQRRTPVVDGLQAQGVNHPPVRLALLSSAVLETWLQRARASLDQAVALTQRFELRHLAAIVASRRQFIDSIPARLLQLQLGGGIS